ncbi:YggT family protein [Jonesiaceae bacterium BS-20]|uniref:YggT family protein n=1 Tax=Jonesiaceae bacterium BS-20 TaxID=3120821 RepID=A0AAU7DX28_9MICO
MIIWAFLSFLCSLFLVVLIGRAVLSWVQMFARQWRPTGFVLVLAEIVYTVTDPPVKFIAKIIPPVRLGGISLDVGFIILFVTVSVLSNIFLQLSLS